MNIKSTINNIDKKLDSGKYDACLNIFLVAVLLLAGFGLWSILSDANKRVDINNYEIISSHNIDYKVLDKSSMPKGDDLSNLSYTLLVENNGDRSIATVDKDEYLGLATGDTLVVTKADV